MVFACDLFQPCLDSLHTQTGLSKMLTGNDLV